MPGPAMPGLRVPRQAASQSDAGVCAARQGLANGTPEEGHSSPESRCPGEHAEPVLVRAGRAKTADLAKMLEGREKKREGVWRSETLRPQSCQALASGHTDLARFDNPKLGPS
jgi:hypothetical protein